MATKPDNLDAARLSANPRATLASWLRYRPYIERAHTLHPEPFVFEPMGFAATTFASRIRDAVRGAIAFDYPTSVPNLREWYSSIIVTFDNRGQVYIGQKPKVASAIVGKEHNRTTDAVYVYDSLSPDELSAFVVLLNAGRLTGPIQINIPNLDVGSLPPNVMLLHKETCTLLL